MRSHAPEGYDCPFCRIAAGEDEPDPWTKDSDVVYHDADVTAFVSAHFWVRNPGHVLIIPNRHYENLYAMPDDVLGKVAVLSKRIAIAFAESYGCDGTSVRQHNEPAGDQDVWHYHCHVFPRYEGDDLYRSAPRLTTPEERRPYAERVRHALQAGAHA
jgi:histidine triad (HIT) family protein